MVILIMLTYSTLVWDTFHLSVSSGGSTISTFVATLTPALPYVSGLAGAKW